MKRRQTTQLIFKRIVSIASVLAWAMGTDLLRAAEPTAAPATESAAQSVPKRAGDPLPGLLPQADNLTIVHPLLMQIDYELQALYRESQTGIARVQLPTPRWQKALANEDNPAGKWSNLDQAVRDQLAAGGPVRPTISSATNPAGNVAAIAALPIVERNRTKEASDESPTGSTVGWNMTRMGPDVILRSQGGTQIQIQTGGNPGGSPADPSGEVRVNLRPTENFAPNNLALLLDDAGHILIPMWLEKNDFEAAPARVAFGDAPPVAANFVASDKPSGITILQLANPPAQLRARPLALADQRPASGALVLLLQPNNGSARLVVWTGGQQDYGVVMAPDGTVMGFAHYGEFLTGAACRPVAQQLIDNGIVKRATLGIGIAVVMADSPLRQSWPALGSRPALQVKSVADHSFAAEGGLQVGDLILGFQADRKGQNVLDPVGDIPSFALALSGRTGPTTLVILREGHERAITVNLKAK